MLFAAMFGQDEGDRVFHQAMALLKNRDSQVEEGKNQGWLDGEGFLKTCDNNDPKYETEALKTAFAMGRIVVSEKI